MTSLITLHDAITDVEIERWNLQKSAIYARGEYLNELEGKITALTAQHDDLERMIQEAA